MTAKILEFDIDKLTLSAEQVDALHKVAAEKKKPRRGKPTTKADPYTYVTARWQIAADKVGAGQVAIALRYIQGLGKSRGRDGAFKVSNARMEEWGVTKWRKMRGLRRLAKAGLILLDETNLHNPVVTILEVAEGAGAHPAEGAAPHP
jgi:hypothetical protein